MIIWLDVHLSPSLAPWITKTFGLEAYSAMYLDLLEAEDETIFMAARQANVVVMTKDSDFVRLFDQLGAPPQVIWLTCGNTSKAKMREILTVHLQTAIELLQNGNDLVEIQGK